MTTDAIILAGGNGSRLEGVAATGMKPFLVVNGEALVSRLVRQARPHVRRVIVVTSPVNTQAMCSLLGASVDYVVQPEPKGPGEALLRALVTTEATRVLVLMGDNHMDDGDISRCFETFPASAIGVRQEVSPLIASRFTRVRVDDKRSLVYSEEGPEFLERGPWTCWCGPLLLNSESARLVLRRYRGEHPKRELKIGPYLNQMTYATPTYLVPVNSRDIGVVEELQ